MRIGPLVWPGGEHVFALPLGELRALQRNCDAGPEEILRRLSGPGWRIDDIIEVLRLGLIGSGAMSEKDAGPEVTRIATLHPLLELRPVAQMVLAAALIGPEDDQPGKPAGAETPPKNGSSARSTETAQ